MCYDILVTIRLFSIDTSANTSFASVCLAEEFNGPESEMLCFHFKRIAKFVVFPDLAHIFKAKFASGSISISETKMTTKNLIRKYFCLVYDYAGKADLSKGYWKPKRELGATTHFLEIMKQQLF